MKKIFETITTILVLAVFAATSASPALAYNEADQPIEKMLGAAFHKEEAWLKRQEAALEKAVRGNERLQNLIDRAKENGLDTADLESAMANFNAAVTEAQSNHDLAAVILAEHEGFDAQGKVTDVELARQTLKDAHQAIQDAHRGLIKAGWDLSDALQGWREANPRPAPEE